MKESMILEKDFYFVRHGQTDHNIREGKLKGDHPYDISLNDTGRSQAQGLEPLITTLPIRTICTSPMKRAQETMQILSARLSAAKYDIVDLGECSAQIWKEMSSLGMNSSIPKEGKTCSFMDRVKKGINQALSLTGTPLIVAHGGVHWALCCLLGIIEHPWAIDNCTLVHFSIGSDKKWIAKRLFVDDNYPPLSKE